MQSLHLGTVWVKKEGVHSPYQCKGHTFQTVYAQVLFLIFLIFC